MSVADRLARGWRAFAHAWVPQEHGGREWIIDALGEYLAGESPSAAKRTDATSAGEKLGNGRTDFTPPELYVLRIAVRAYMHHLWNQGRDDLAAEVEAELLQLEKDRTWSPRERSN